MLTDFKRIRELEQTFGSPFYLFDVNKLRTNYEKMNNAFKSKYSNFIIGYSYKTNYLPFLCKELANLGAYAEVVSRLEYDLAMKIGVTPTKIIFNGPLKTYQDIEMALNNGSILNIDSLYEINLLKKYCEVNKGKQVRIGIRLNFDLSHHGEDALQEGYEVSRFGVCTSNGDLDTAVEQLNQIKNITIIGVHGHFSTKERKVETYKNITNVLCSIAKQYFPETIEYVDIGGGFYGELPESFNIDSPSFDDYANAVCTMMNQEFADLDRKPYLIIEPGISMVANVFTFIAKVIETKKMRNKHFVLIDGSVHNIKPTMHKRNLPMRIVKKDLESTSSGTYNIVGYTCMEKDYLANDVNGLLPVVNDYILFENVGAYTIVFNPPFIKERPCIIAVDQNEYFVVRKKESFKEFFNEELYIF
ncbi:diaminopimelate decarboxylase [Heyndrickxia sporothermodurans]|nr:diaminopimelate decarboxylase [Heyndrickxia sporothermodurans]